MILPVPCYAGLFLLGGMQYECCGAESDYSTILDAQSLSVSENPVHYECAYNASVVAYGVCKLAECIALYIHYAVAAVHTAVLGLYGQCYFCTLVVSANDVVAHSQLQNLLESEAVLYYDKMSEVFLNLLYVVLAYAYCKTLAAAFAFEYYGLAYGVAAIIEYCRMVAFGTDYLLHALLVVIVHISRRRGSFPVSPAIVPGPLLL